jgi:hypothetical protein
MTMTRRSAAGAESTSIGPPVTTVPDHWQVSQYFPIRGVRDPHRLAMGWTRGHPEERRYSKRAFKGIHRQNVQAGGGDRQEGDDRRPRPPPGSQASRLSKARAAHRLSWHSEHAGIRPRPLVSCSATSDPAAPPIRGCMRRPLDAGRVSARPVGNERSTHRLIVHHPPIRLSSVRPSGSKSRARGTVDPGWLSGEDRRGRRPLPCRHERRLAVLGCQFGDRAIRCEHRSGPVRLVVR